MVISNLNDLSQLILATAGERDLTQYNRPDNLFEPSEHRLRLFFEAL